MSLDFQRKLFRISEALVTHEVEALKFLCLDYIPMGNLEAVQNAQDLFRELQEKGMIEARNLFFLKELLYRIDRINLLSAYLDSSREEMKRELKIPGKAQVSPYRRLLYDIAKETSRKDVQDVKFLLGEGISRSRHQDNPSMFMVLTEMEKKGMIKEGDLTKLKDVLKGFRADLAKKIDIYEEKYKVKNTSRLLSYPAPVRRGLKFLSLKKGTGFYKMQNNPHGYCVILNNYTFKNPFETREGTEKDGEAVKRVFTWLQFETVEYMDLEASQMIEIVKEYSQKDHSNMDCFVCFIFSHGEKENVEGTDHKLVNIKELFSCFSGSNCPSLAGKPKLFFIQACQGFLGHPGVTVKEDFSGHFETDATPLNSIPDLADMLFGMATVENYECYRSTQTGSIYIQCLCEKLELLCPLRKDIHVILADVNNEVASKVFNGEKQMPQIISTLRKQLIFQTPCQPTEE
ncbi:CASP8 protein, partial [Rhinopomastus cyanomelas]|nr:CASP8 protein [Rhinopomastus cyanomelas]